VNRFHAGGMAEEETGWTDSRNGVVEVCDHADCDDSAQSSVEAGRRRSIRFAAGAVRKLKRVLSVLLGPLLPELSKKDPTSIVRHY